MNLDKNHFRFEQIKFLDTVADDLVTFAALKYGQDFYDYADISCGAMPKGEYEQIIDPSAPEQFLKMYYGIVSKRIKMACIKILELDSSYKKLLEDYFEKAKEPATALGLELKLEEIIKDTDNQ